jgi:hypothetical protein
MPANLNVPGSARRIAATPTIRALPTKRLFPFLTTLTAMLAFGQSLAAEIELKLAPGGAAALFNPSLDTPVRLTSYSISRGAMGVELVPTQWDSLQVQGNPFAVDSATLDLLSEAALAEGLLFNPGQSRSIGLPFNLGADADGDGLIDLTDFSIWTNHRGQQLLGPSFGDFDYSGVVDGADFEFLLTGMGTSAVYTFAATTAIPEPETLVLVGVAIAALLAVRRFVTANRPLAR